MAAVDEIKQRLDIIELISSYTPLHKAGHNYKGLCPFHTEKTPSFVVFPDTQSWHCFGACGTGGDMFSFIMRRENMDFVEAMRFLAEKAGVQLIAPSQEQIILQDETEQLRQVNVAAAQFFHRYLVERPEGAYAKSYLVRRGLTEQTINTFQLGFAPDAWHLLGEALLRQFPADLILTAGLTIKNDAGNVYDRFRNRLIFPICDIQGRVIGFAGRVLDESMPKYLNTPQTPLFDKGSVLYGFDLARQSIRDSGQAIVVEGYMDVIVPYQCGVKNVVAVMGTALTDAHIDALKKTTRELILALDPDAAGLRATERGWEVARAGLEHRLVPIPTAEGLIRYEEKLSASIRVLELPDGLDPDELVLSDRQRWDMLVANADPVVDYFINLTIAQADLSSAKGKRTAADRLLRILASIENSVERSHYLQQVAQLLRIDERTLSFDLDHLRKTVVPKAHPAAGQREQTNLENIELEDNPKVDLTQRCLALLLTNPPLAREIIQNAELDQEAFQDERDRQVFSVLINTESLQLADEIKGYFSSLDSELGLYVESLLSKLKHGPPIPPDTFREDVLKSSVRLQRYYLAQRIGELRFAQQEAHAEGDTERERELYYMVEQVVQAHRRSDQLAFASTYIGRRRQH
ncbi:MAG: DNA primase [Anaerolineae bacterium]